MSTYPFAPFVSTTPLPISTGEVLDKLWKTLRGNWKMYLWLGSPLAAAGILFLALYAVALYASGIFPLHPGVMPDLRVIFWVYGAMLLGLFQTCSSSPCIKQPRLLPRSVKQEGNR
jgi:hypothetical protein